MDVKRLGILVVHGIGEQKHFDTLEDVALNFAKALKKKQPNRPESFFVQVLHGDQKERHSYEEPWRESPVRVRWDPGSGAFREAS